jgi:biopolymer transport protein ExbB
LLSIIQAAGWPIWPLILCSVIALALVVERFWRLRAPLVAPPTLLDEVMGVTRSSLPGTDVVDKLAQNSVLGTVLAAGLRAVVAEPRITEDALRQAFENAGRVARSSARSRPRAATTPSNSPTASRSRSTTRLSA